MDAPPLGLNKGKGVNGENESVNDSSEFNPSNFFTGSFVDSTKKYRDSVTVDFGNYGFGTEQVAATNKEEENNSFDSIDNLDGEGNFKVNKYRINFAPDLIYANAAYSTLYGLIGTSVISFSGFWMAIPSASLISGATGNSYPAATLRITPGFTCS